MNLPLMGNCFFSEIVYQKIIIEYGYHEQDQYLLFSFLLELGRTGIF